jgi:hypothetical protein
MIHGGSPPLIKVLLQTLPINILEGFGERGVAEGVTTALVRLVELEVGNLLKVLEIAGEEGQVMRKTRCRDQDIQITDLLSDRPGKAASDLGKAFHD